MTETPPFCPWRSSTPGFVVYCTNSFALWVDDACSFAWLGIRARQLEIERKEVMAQWAGEMDA